MAPVVSSVEEERALGPQAFNLLTFRYLTAAALVQASPSAPPGPLQLPSSYPASVESTPCLASSTQNPAVILTLFSQSHGGPGMTQPPPVTSIFYPNPSLPHLPVTDVSLQFPKPSRLFSTPGPLFSCCLEHSIPDNVWGLLIPEVSA